MQDDRQVTTNNSITIVPLSITCRLSSIVCRPSTANHYD